MFDMKDHTARRAAACLSAAVVLLPYITAAAVPTNLRCEYRKNPLGLDAEKPRLSWVIAEKSDVRGQRSEVRDQRSEVRSRVPIRSWWPVWKRC
jgi:hypothetical protein